MTDYAHRTYEGMEADWTEDPAATQRRQRHERLLERLWSKGNVDAAERLIDGLRADVPVVSPEVRQRTTAYPISPDAVRGNSSALTPSPDAEGRVRLRDPGLGIGDAGEPSFTVNATGAPIVAVVQEGGDALPLTHASFFSGAGGTQPTLGLSVPDGTPSASRRSTPTPAPSSPSDGPEYRTWGVSQRRSFTNPNAVGRSLSTEAPMIGPAQPSGPAASPARTSASPESAEVSQANGPASPSHSSPLWSDTDLPQILLENVPGLLSSHGGRDMARLIGEMVELGYGVAYRILDAQHFGVPQRRRRVFILGLRSDPDDADGRVAAERAAEVLSVGSRCGRHPATGHEKGPGVAERPERSPDVIGTVPAALGHHGYTLGQEALSNGFLQLSTPPDSDGVREADGLAGWSHDQQPMAFVKAGRAQTVDDDESWVEGRVMPTLNSFDVGDARTTAAILSPTLRVGAQRNEDGGPGDTVPVIAQTLTAPDTRHRIANGKRQDGSRLDRIPTVIAATLNSGGNDGGFRTEPGEHLTTGGGVSDDPMLPLGLDSNRYRCCGNGVVSFVSEWVGIRLRDYFLSGDGVQS